MALTKRQRQQSDSMTTTQAAPTQRDTHKPAAGPPVRRRPSDFARKGVMALTGRVFGVFVFVHMRARQL
jgi:hypothetical protein